MNRRPLFGLAIASALSFPAVAMDHGDESREPHRAVKALKQMDANGDGMISFDEFRPPEGRDTPEMRMDSDGDGLITKRELKEARGERRRKMQERGGRRGHHPKGGHRGAHADRPD